MIYWLVPKVFFLIDQLHLLQVVTPVKYVQSNRFTPGSLHFSCNTSVIHKSIDYSIVNETRYFYIRNMKKTVQGWRNSSLVRINTVC